MSNIRQNINTQLVAAMRAKDAVALGTLRGLVSAMQVAEKATPGALLTDADVTKVLVKAAAQRRDSVALYTEQSRPDLADKEAAELAIIDALLPKQLNAGELNLAVTKHVYDNNYKGLGAMKEAMATFNAKYAGQVNPKDVGPLVKAALVAE